MLLYRSDHLETKTINCLVLNSLGKLEFKQPIHGKEPGSQATLWSFSYSHISMFRGLGRSHIIMIAGVKQATYILKIVKEKKEKKCSVCLFYIKIL